MKYAMLVAFLAVATPAFGADRRISISVDGKPILKGVKIDVECGSRKYGAETDAKGQFQLRLDVPGTARCVLKTTYEGQTPSVDIFVSEGAVMHYNLVLERKDGKLTLNVREAIMEEH